MCGIIGAFLQNVRTENDLLDANEILQRIWSKTIERGRDGQGFLSIKDGTIFEYRNVIGNESNLAMPPRINSPCSRYAIIGNFRAEPTTEFVKNKSTVDQQPYCVGDWSIVHNGSIANDKHLRTNEIKSGIDSCAIAEQLAISIDDHTDAFVGTVDRLVGSYAILALNKTLDTLYIACNYKPIWYIETELGFFFASSEEYFPSHTYPKMLEPYRCYQVKDGRLLVIEDDNRPKNNTALVVCSGGLDSVVAATYAQKIKGYDVHLLHFTYGTRSEKHEINAVSNVANALGVRYTVLPIDLYNSSDSPLLNNLDSIASGKEGAKFAFEWVPARNLVMLSLATAFAEIYAFDVIILGNNLEESGAYPDNEPEFIKKFNKILPFAVHSKKALTVEMPVGNLMKHEIVKLGNEIGAPMHLTWSCYNKGTQHCGVCAPCYMRQEAFKMNNLKEVIEYE